MKKDLLFLLVLFFGLFYTCILSGQTRYLVTPDTPFRYFAGTSEPDPDWLLPGFDDSSWPSDTGTIGYGYDPEAQQVGISSEAHSVYLRYRFHVENINDVNEANFFADFDDGYVAWINGKEVVRVNVDGSIEHPAHDQHTTRSHAMQTYGWDYRYPVLGYYLDSLMLDSCLTEGENILSVQVLNDSANGSDLQFGLILYDITRANYFYFNWDSRYKAQVALDSSRFPLVVVETDEWGIPYKNRRRKAFMGIIDNGPEDWNRPGDSCNVYYGDISMEVRGQSSSEFPKRSYRFEFIDSLENDSNVAVMGMPADDDWILMGPYHDKAQFRNNMVFEMGRTLNGSYQPRTRFCQLIMNGEFLGLYVLCETIKRNNDRVDIARLRESEISGNDLTGGYILRYDKPMSSLQIVYPKEDKIRQEQTDYILGFMDAYLEVLRSAYFTDPKTGFRKYINDTSLVDYLIVNEITKNADSYLNSTYMYKDRDDRDPRLHFGPLWDYDLAFGNSYFQQGNLTYGWQFDNGTNTKLRVTKLFQDEALVDLFQERYHAAREGCFHTDSLFFYIDSMVAYLEEPVESNYQVWPIIDKDLFFPNYQSMSYAEEIWNIKNWMTDRLEWIDENIDDIYYPLVIPDVIDPIPDIPFSFDVYPNPFSAEVYVDMTTGGESDLQLEFIDLMGTVRCRYRQMLPAGDAQFILDDPSFLALPKGIYLLRVSLNGNPNGLQRVVKK